MGSSRNLVIKKNRKEETFLENKPQSIFIQSNETLVMQWWKSYAKVELHRLASSKHDGIHNVAIALGRECIVLLTKFTERFFFIHNCIKATNYKQKVGNSYKEWTVRIEKRL